jgi:hypothetical protein
VQAIAVPTLLVRGGLSDVLSEEGAQQFLALCPRSEYVNVTSAGNMVAGGRKDAQSVHYLDTNAMGLLNSLRALSIIGCIGVKPQNRRPLEASLSYYFCSPIAVLHARCRYGHCHQQSEGVDHDVALAAFDLFATIEPGFTALWRGAGCLGVNRSSAGACMAPHAQTLLLA